MTRNSVARIAAVVLAICCFAPAQQPPTSAGQGTPNQEKSLADIAKEAREKKASHAKNTITDEDLANRSPIPPINLEGLDNFDQIIAAIVDYRSKHTKEQTEQVIHDWYDEYDAMLVAAIRNTTESEDRRKSTLFTGFQLCQNSSDYQKCQLKYEAEMRGARHDQMVIHDDSMTIGRVQQTFTRVRNELAAHQNLRYDWFKIRSANGVGNF